MSKKRLLLVAGVAFAALLVAGLLGLTTVSAQEPPPETQIPPGGRGGRFPGGFGGRHFGGRGLLGMGGGGQWTTFDAAAEVLGLAPEELFAELHGGTTLAEIAEEQGVEMDALREAMDAAHADAMREGIEQAVEDGALTQEQADWMREGLDRGFFPMGRGFGRGRGIGFRCSPED
jgi:hypothetical protein